MYRPLTIALTLCIAGCGSSSDEGGQDPSSGGGTAASATEGNSATADDSVTADDSNGDDSNGDDSNGDDSNGDDSNGDDSSGDDSTDDSSGPSCGNGMVDDGEVCDGEAGLAATSCASLGYVAGAIACAETCVAFDETGCSDSAICGDSQVSETEACEVDVSGPETCGVNGSGEQTCIDCQWSVTSCCPGTCTEGCDNACGADANDLSGTWTFLFFNNGWQGPDPTMIMELNQDGSALSGSFTTDAWFLGDHEFEGGERDANDVYLHVPITQLDGGMIMEGTVCGACSMFGVTDPQGGLNSDWTATRER